MGMEDMEGSPQAGKHTRRYGLKTGAAGVVRNHMWWSMGAGLIPLPFVDLAVISGVQIKMLRSLSDLYGNKFDDSRGKAIMASLGCGMVASSVGGGTLRTLLKIVPGVGTLAGAASVSVLAGAMTYALGKVFVMHFESGGTLLDFEPGKMREHYYREIERGKKVAEDMKAGKAA